MYTCLLKVSADVPFPGTALAPVEKTSLPLPSALDSREITTFR